MVLFDELRREYEQLVSQLSTGAFDSRERGKMQKRVAELQEILVLHDAQKQVSIELVQLQQQRSVESDTELQELFDEEIAQLTGALAQYERDLDDLLYPADEHDVRSVYLEIRAGAGGQEAALFVSNLFSMYQAYADSQRWSVSVENMHQTDIGGYKELVLFIKGKNVYKHLKFESGVHRVQRVPATETQGRIHTSTVTVAVMPEADEIDVEINQNDLRIDTYRASGAGGQHINKTDSAVRITHLPSGIVVQCQEERSQIKNRAKAMKMLYARLLESEKSRQVEQERATRKQQVGTGERSEKIRTYNFPQNRVTDHRIGLTLKKLDLIMQGLMSEIIEALLDAERKQRRAS